MRIEHGRHAGARGRRGGRPRCAALALLGAALLGGACAPAATPAAPPAAAPAAAPTRIEPAASAPSAAAAPAASSRPTLATTPAVDLTVGVLELGAYAPYFVALDRGYFQELGLNVQLVGTPNLQAQAASLATGQMQVGSCGTNIACYNAMNRGTDVQIVADLASAGKTPKATGSTGLVVRKDLWDAGAIRTPQDLRGRTIYVGSVGNGPWILGAHWLRGLGIDPMSLDWGQLAFPDVYAAMQNGGIEVGFQTEPFMSSGLTRGVHETLANQEEMYPEAQILWLMYWKGIERLGPQVGERFMVAYLRAARDYIDAFEQGVDQDLIIASLTQHTPIKDPAVYRQMKYTWMRPNGEVNRAAIEADTELLRELGVASGPTNLSGAFEDKYRQFAVQYLGER